MYDALLYNKHYVIKKKNLSSNTLVCSIRLLLSLKLCPDENRNEETKQQNKKITNNQKHMNKKNVMPTAHRYNAMNKSRVKCVIIML